MEREGKGKKSQNSEYGRQQEKLQSLSPFFGKVFPVK
jgi:hypothetical protein